MRVILFAENLKEKEAAHEYLKDRFELPDHYGKNLDALYDCLSEIRDLEIIILVPEHQGEYEGGYLESLMPVFEEAGKVTFVNL